MTCRTIGPVIVCGRGRPRRLRPHEERPRCRVPDCPRYATQAGWGCQPDWFRLPQHLRDALFRASRDDQTGTAWAHAAAEADRWIADHPKDAPKRDRRQRELFL